MKIKTYIVPNLTDAVEQIKRELGPKAVILSTRRSLYSEKWWKPARPSIEVTAGVDLSDEMMAAPVSSMSMPAVSVAAALPNSSQLSTGLVGRLMGSRLGSVVSRVTGLGLQTVQEASVALNSIPSSARRSPPAEADVQVQADTILRITSRLLWHHLDSNLVSTLADELMAETGEFNPAEITENAAQWLYDKLPETLPYQPRQPRILALVGPTGSGKTTTLAKIGSLVRLNARKKLAFISLDPYKIGSAEQLGHFAKILMAPLALASEPRQFHEALTRFANYDAILVDTAGRSHLDPAEFSRLNDIFKVEPRTERVLVVPAHLRDPDLKNMEAGYHSLGIARVVVTKLDETRAFGSLYNVSYRTQKPLTFFTMGQEIPEDIEVATKERVIDCLLNFSGNYPIAELEAALPAGEAAASQIQ